MDGNPALLLAGGWFHRRFAPRDRLPGCRVSRHFHFKRRHQSRERLALRFASNDKPRQVRASRREPAFGVGR